MASRRHSAALILIVLASCAEDARDIGAPVPAAGQCFTLSITQAFDQAGGSSLQVSTGGQIFELELSGDCAGSEGTGIAMIEAGSSAPICVGQSGGDELIIRHPATQQTSVCHIEAVRRLSPDPAN